MHNILLVVGNTGRNGPWGSVRLGSASARVGTGGVSSAPPRALPA